MDGLYGVYLYTTHENGKWLGNIGDGSYCPGVRHISTNLIVQLNPIPSGYVRSGKWTVGKDTKNMNYLLTMVIFHFGKFNNQRI